LASEVDGEEGTACLGKALYRSCQKPSREPEVERAMEREVHSQKVARVLPSQKDAMASCRSGHSDSGLSLSGGSMARTGETRTSAIMASCEKDVFTFALLSKLNARLWNDAVDPFQQ
jgi:hypothetical protein